MSHLDEGTLHALLDGEIPSAELGPIQTHLSACGECRARLEAERNLLGEADGLVGLIEAPPHSGAPEARPRRQSRGGRSWTRGLAWAATVVGAVGLGYAARDLGSRPGPPPAGPLALADSSAGRDAALPVSPPMRPSAESRAEPPATPPRSPAPSPGRMTPAGGGGRRAASAPAPVAAEVGEVRRERTRLDELEAQRRQQDIAAAVQPAAAAKLALAPPSEVVEFPEALRRLNGSLRLIPGLIPIRLEAAGATVRVIYPAAGGELVLSQELRDGRLVVTLTAPAGFPADSLERLRAMVRE